MADAKKFVILRKVLGALGLPEEAVEELIAWIEALLAGKDKGGGAGDDHPYRLRDDFLSPAERSFYLVVKGAVSSWADVCPKVNLADLFYVACKDPGQWRACTNRIDRKHVDFLLCDPRDAAPLVGVELDDSSHRRRRRQQRDELVDRVFQAAGLPLVRVVVRPAYNPRELDRLLREAAGAPEPAASPEAGQAGAAPAGKPTCPRCGAALVLRTARSGRNKGGRFWGCTNFPKCRFTASGEKEATSPHPHPASA